MCRFAIEWDPDFIPFSVSHFEGRRDLKLDQIVLKNMVNNIYHLSNEYGFYHGDLHTENFLYNVKGDIKRFDFDFSGIITQNNGTKGVENYQINIFFGGQLSKISMYLFMNLYKRNTEDTTRPWSRIDTSTIWNPTAPASSPKWQHKGFLILFDIHRMLLHYFISIKDPKTINQKEIIDTIDILYSSRDEKPDETHETHKMILKGSVANNIRSFSDGPATGLSLVNKIGSEMFHENTWNGGCMYSLSWYFGKHILPGQTTAENATYDKWYNYDNHLKFFELHLNALLLKATES